MDREFIAERQKGLQNYLNVITSNHILSNCELVKKFLDPNSYSVNYVGKCKTLKFLVRASYRALTNAANVFVKLEKTQNSENSLGSEHSSDCSGAQELPAVVLQ